jgi:hypothetical protein
VKRRTLTLSDGMVIEIRRMTRADSWAMETLDPAFKRILCRPLGTPIPEEDQPATFRLALEIMRRAVVSPRLVIEGLPTPETDQDPTIVHVLDLADEDFETLWNVVNAFSMEGWTGPRVEKPQQLH